MRHLLKLALLMLAGVASYYVYGFTVQVAPFPIALGAAGSLVGTYVGLAFADVPSDQRSRAMYVARAAMIVEALYGFLFVLAQQSPEWFAVPMHPALSIALAALHGAAFSVLAFFVSLFIVHERGGLPETPADARDRVIVETLHAIVTRLDAPRLAASDRPLLEKDVSSVRLETSGEPLSGQIAAISDGRTADGRRTDTEGDAEDFSSNVETSRKTYICKRCGAGPFSFADLGRHSHQHKRDAV